MTDDIDYRGREAYGERILLAAIPEELKQSMVTGNRMGFSELSECQLFPRYFVVTTIDGLGSKVHLASAMGRYDTIGIDLVHTNANDFVAHPANGRARPFLFLNYLACQDKILEEGIAGEIMKGIVQGLYECNVEGVLNIKLGKGETASMQDTISGPKYGYGFDIAGAMVGFLRKREFLTPEPGDLIIALPSSGGHTNGYTDLRFLLLNGNFEERPEVRQKYRGRFHLDDKMPGSDVRIGEALLEPTRGYMKFMTSLHEGGIKAIGVNISGFGLHNANRVGHDVKYVIHSPLEMHSLFRLTQEESKLSDYEIYRRFNGGMGFLVITKPNDVEEVMKISQELDIPSNVVGEVNEHDGEPVTVLIKDGKDVLFEGYG